MKILLFYAAILYLTYLAFRFLSQIKIGDKSKSDSISHKKDKYEKMDIQDADYEDLEE